jgi:hypothetical protein
MKNVPKKTLTLILLSLLMISATIGTVKAGTGPAVYSSPSTVTLPQGTALGYKFNVTVYIANITSSQPAFAWQVQISFNNTQLTVNRAGYTAGATSQFLAGHITSSPGASIKNANGYVLIGESLLGSDNASTGAGVTMSLFWVEFKVNATSGTLHSVLSLTGTRTWVKDINLVVIPINVSSTNYVYLPEFIPIIALLAFAAVSTFVIAMKKKRNLH